jgi:2-oxoisovalerate dehydrogenase E1 component alpha subunit
MVSRLYGHSSSSGALRVKNEPDCVALFEKKLLDAGIASAEAIERVHRDAEVEVESALDQAMTEPRPTSADVERFTYAPSRVDAVYPSDYSGLPS